jgi:N-formylglutamate amidohydrolase
VARRHDSPLPFGQAYHPGRLLTIGFESARVTSSDYEVDLTNSGINQILSVAAVRDHRLLHFSMADLHDRDGEYVADAKILALDPAWDRADPHHAHRHLRVVDLRTIPLAEAQLLVVRGDDIRTERTVNVEILQWAAGHAKVLESVEATLSTTDKYAPIERGPQLPHPVTFAAATVSQALEAIVRLPREEPYFVLKDRTLPTTTMSFQEFRGEVADGDLVVTFFDDELIGALRRVAPEGEWRTNASIGAEEVGVTLTPEQESIARALKRSFPECRLASVDLLESGRILEINAFPGGEGLLRNYDIVLGEIVLDRLEEELLGTGVQEKAAALTWKAERPAHFPTGTQWPEVEELYPAYEGEREVYDVLSGDRFRMGIRDLIEFHPRSPEYILSIPHAGVLIPEAFRDRFSLDESSLVEIDLYSDLCYEMADGMHLRSELAPFFVDMNRARKGSDDGELPRHLANPAHEYYTVEDRLMLREPYTPEEEEDVLRYHDLYHGLLDRLIDRMRRERGYALLFDCHSMTSTGLGRVEDKGEDRADFVAGTLHGTSAHEAIVDAFMSTLSREASGHGLGLTIARDVPYSGGFITRSHHDPAGHVHVMQLEVAMDAYMYEAGATPPKRYALKRPRLRIVRRAVQEAFRAAAEAAERIYH